MYRVICFTQANTWCPDICHVTVFGSGLNCSLSLLMWVCVMKKPLVEENHSDLQRQCLSVISSTQEVSGQLCQCCRISLLDRESSTTSCWKKQQKNVQFKYILSDIPLCYGVFAYIYTVYFKCCTYKIYLKNIWYFSCFIICTDL